MDFFLIGHRTSGKTTLASAIAALQPHLFSAIDLDRVIEQEEERTCAQIIAQHEPYFRQLEIAYLDKLLALDTHDTPHRLITPGAGCLHLPQGPLAIWIQRDGWMTSALSQRARLRPRLAPERELEAMRLRREPVWAARAHAILPITHGTPVQTSIQRLLEVLLAMLQAPESTLTQKSFLIPSTPTELTRAHADHHALGTQGIELRSDLLPHLSPEDLLEETPYLLSLRSPDTTWLQNLCPFASRIDIDIELLETFEKNIEKIASPDEVILSSHPPKGAERSTQELLANLEEAASRIPHGRHAITLKLAPWYDSFAALLEGFDTVQNTSHTYPLTFLPQGRQFAWMRPWLATHRNATNYLPVTLHPIHQQTMADEDAIARAAYFDLHDWLPHLTSEAPTHFDALLGDPVDASQGDWWHRMEAIRQGETHRSYLKIPVPRTSSQEEWRALFTLLERMQIHGLSITAPHKRTICELPWTAPADGASAHLEAANTLAYDQSTRTWLYCDTDHHGLIATLEHLTQEAGIEPGSIILIGQGGVSPAITSAIEASTGWSLVHHASAREGWTEETPSHATLVINAAGNLDTPYHNPPSCTVWIDLHYRDVRVPPSSCTLHLNGDIFFAAQARAQRTFWAKIRSK